MHLRRKLPVPRRLSGCTIFDFLYQCSISARSTLLIDLLHASTTAGGETSTCFFLRYSIVCSFLWALYRKGLKRSWQLSYRTTTPKRYPFSFLKQIVACPPPFFCQLFFRFSDQFFRDSIGSNSTDTENSLWPQCAIWQLNPATTYHVVYVYVS